MLMIFLAGVLGNDTTALRPAMWRDVQQAAIDTITGKASMAQPRQIQVPQNGRTRKNSLGDAQTEIVAWITGHNVTHPASSGQAYTVVDPQTAILRSLTGRK